MLSTSCAARARPHTLSRARYLKDGRSDTSGFRSRMQPTVTVLHRLRLPETSSSSVWLVLRILFHPRTSCSTRSWQRHLKRLRTSWKTADDFDSAVHDMIKRLLCRAHAASFSAAMVTLRNGLKRQSAVDFRTSESMVSMLSRQSGHEKAIKLFEELWRVHPGPSWSPAPRLSMRHIPRPSTSRQRR